MAMKFNSVWSVARLPLFGAAVGYATGYAWDNVLKNNKAWFLALLGALIGYLFVPLHRWIISQGKQVELDSVQLDLPVIGIKAAVKLNDAHRVVGWKLFIESSTRVTTQSLGADEGFIREALTSLHKFFEITRTELKTMKPSPIPVDPNTFTVETYALKMLNDGLRGMLSRWHPRLSKWEKMNLPESDWPLAEYCRKDLESTRTIMLAYTWGLGEIIKASRLSDLLPPKPQGATPVLFPMEDIKKKECDIETTLVDTERMAAWHILVELRSRIATQPLPSDQGFLSEAIASLYKLFDSIRSELKIVSPAPRISEQEKSGVESIQSIGLTILNAHLRPFLAKWHPLLTNWQTKNPDESEYKWPERKSCRDDLEKTRAALEKEAVKLKTLLKIQNLLD